MILIDSCGWIEFLVDGEKAGEYANYFADAEQITTPTIVIYEVYKKVLRERTEEEAVMVVAQMNKTVVVDLNEHLALLAAGLSLKHGLPMANAIVYGTAKACECQVATSDKHFLGLEQVVFI
ncbi:MAG: type II toxin-antitoxin system VapC family toxin [Syntrophomonadaceae bacterium]|nr:type II toxin-antitoxin system VapC family toxin [Syntrophomonadaceae bacterium]